MFNFVKLISFPFYNDIPSINVISVFYSFSLFLSLFKKMSYRYIESENGLQTLMKQFAPPEQPLVGNRINQVVNGYKEKPLKPSEWAKFDVCGGNGISAGLVASVFDQQLMVQGGQAVQIKWDENDDAFNSALFPVVVRWSTGERGRAATKFRGEVEHTLETHAFPVVYRACFSRFPPVMGSQIPHQPDFKEIRLHKVDEFGVAIQGQTEHMVYVDTALIGDEHCARSIVASLENSSVQNGGYIYFFPEVSDTVRSNANLPFKNPDDHKVSGASLGMAIFAAVQGWPSILYTGYTSFIVPGYKIQHNSNYSQQTAAAMGNPRPQYYGGAPQSWSSQGMTVYGDSYAKIAKQIDFVDSVQDLPFKMILSVFHKIPIVIPMSGSFGETTSSYVDVANKNWKTSLLNFFQLTYTMANSERGLPTVITDGANKYARLLYMGKTIAEFMLLAYLAQNAQAVANGKTAEADSDKWKPLAERFQTAWRDNRLTQAANTKQRMLEYNKPKKDLNKLFEEGKINQQEWTKEVDTLNKKRLGVKKAKKAAKSSRSAENAAKRLQIKQTIDASLEAYHDAYNAAKANLGPKPSAKEKKLFNQQWPSPGSAKKRLNKDAFKRIVSVNLVNDRAKGQSTMALQSRYSRAEDMITAGVQPAAIVASLNVFFPKLDPVPTTIATNDDLLSYLKSSVTDVMDANRALNPIKNVESDLYNPKSNIAFYEQRFRDAQKKAAAAVTLQEKEKAKVAVENARNNLQDAQDSAAGSGVNAIGTGNNAWDRSSSPPSSSNPFNQPNEPYSKDGVIAALLRQTPPKLTPLQLSDWLFRYAVEKILLKEDGDELTDEEDKKATEWANEIKAKLLINGYRLAQNNQSTTATSKFRGITRDSGRAFGSATKYSADASSKFTGAGRLPQRRIINQPGNEYDMSSWNPFSFLEDAGKEVLNVAKDVVGTAAKTAIPLAGAMLASKFK